MGVYTGLNYPISPAKQSWGANDGTVNEEHIPIDTQVFAWSATGGAATSGDGLPIKIKDYAASGGIVAGGRADLLKIKAFEALGGASLDGAAATSYVAGGGPVVVPAGAVPSVGGWFDEIPRNPYAELRQKIERERISLEISRKASAVIERVAREQAKRTEVENEVARTAELVQEMERAGIAWKRAYDQALSAYRDYLLTAEIAALMEARGIYAEYDRRLSEDYNAAVGLLLLQEH